MTEHDFQPPTVPAWLTPALDRYHAAEDGITENLRQQHQAEADMLNAALAKLGIRPVKPARACYRFLEPAELVEPWLDGAETWGVKATWKDGIRILAVNPYERHKTVDVGPYISLDAIARLVKLGPDGLQPVAQTPGPDDEQDQVERDQLAILRLLLCEHLAAALTHPDQAARQVLTAQFARPLQDALDDAGIDIGPQLTPLLAAAHDEHPERFVPTQRTGEPDGAVHLSPAPGYAFTPCCGRTPFELSASERMTVDTEAVTCPGRKD